MRRREYLEVYEEIDAEIEEILGTRDVDLFEIGRSEAPNGRRYKKNYDHVRIVSPPLDCQIASLMEDSLIKEFADDDRYNPDAARHGGGGCPDSDVQWLYVVWNETMR